ncbi:tail tip assembly protein L [Klebsiella phage vB_KshKPC-M]|nr:tail tip assembly protein L [Klebsiella phage vB_KshKPC-M]
MQPMFQKSLRTAYKNFSPARSKRRSISTPQSSAGRSTDSITRTSPIQPRSFWQRLTAGRFSQRRSRFAASSTARARSAWAGSQCRAMAQWKSQRRRLAISMRKRVLLFAPTTASCKPKLRYGFWSRNCYKTTAALKRAILGDLSTTSSAQNRSTRKKQRSNQHPCLIWMDKRSRHAKRKPFVIGRSVGGTSLEKAATTTGRTDTSTSKGTGLTIRRGMFAAVWFLLAGFVLVMSRRVSAVVRQQR